MNVAAGVLVIHCSDPRYQAQFHDFLRNRLRLDKYALIAVPGGAQFLTLLEYLPKFSWAGWKWVKFLAEQGNTARVILIAHEDCQWYKDNRFAPLAHDVRDKQLRDLREVCAGLRERFGSNRVELYYMQRNRGEAVFEPV